MNAELAALKREVTKKFLDELSDFLRIDILSIAYDRENGTLRIIYDDGEGESELNMGYYEKMEGGCDIQQTIQAWRLPVVWGDWPKNYREIEAFNEIERLVLQKINRKWKAFKIKGFKVESIIIAKNWFFRTIKILRDGEVLTATFRSSHGKGDTHLYRFTTTGKDNKFFQKIAYEVYKIALPFLQ